PWDSPHNKKLVEKMPKVFDATGNAKTAGAGRTTFLVPHGDVTAFPGQRGVRIREVPDGTSNTIAVVDADDGHAVPWTKPEDLEYDPKQPARGLSLRYGDGYLAAFLDGSVHFVRKTAAKETLQALFTRGGGEVTGPYE